MAMAKREAEFEASIALLRAVLGIIPQHRMRVWLDYILVAFVKSQVDVMVTVTGPEGSCSSRKRRRSKTHEGGCQI
jgi:hypothetical protein